MKKAKFYFKLTSKGSLENVFFFPENEQSSIIITRDDDRKVWENKGFELMVDEPFDYLLRVFGVTGTEWEAELKIFAGNEKKDFLQWSGTTGDTRRNISERTKPVKDLP